MIDEHHAEQLPEAKLVELESSFIDGDNRDLADDEEIFFPIYVGELRELLRGYRAQRAFAAREADLVDLLVGSTERLESVLAAMGKYNETHGTAIIGPSLLGAGTQIAANRAELKSREARHG